MYEERINKIEKEKEIKNKELEELKAKVEERKKWQEYIYNVILNTPKEYIIATSFDRVTYIDKTDKNLEVIT